MFKKTTRIIVIIAALIMSISMGACGDNADEQKETTEASVEETTVEATSDTTETTVEETEAPAAE